MPTKPSYNDGLQYLYNLEKYGMRFGLKRIKTLLKYLGNPQDKLSIIHIGGTNGKGSTSAMIASVLAKAGYKVGLYTSPHLARFNERIRISGKEITDKKIVGLVEKVRNAECGMRNKKIKNSHQPTFFEFTTAMAFLYFAEEKVDFAVMEVGLGGRLDATNVGRPLVSVITNIAKDHQAILGNRISNIAFEKAGIIKKNGVLISAETKSAAANVLMEECKKKKAIFYRLNRDFFVDENRESGISNQKSEVRRFTFRGRRWVLKDLETNLLGRHQYYNAACALAALEILEETCPRMFLSGKGFCIPESAVRNGLQHVFWPGRLEIVSKRPLIVLDCAHNAAGAEVLKEALWTTPLPPLIRGNNRKYKIVNCKSNKRLFLVLGIMADKDMKGILSKLVPLAHTVILTRPKTERAAPLDMLYKEIMELRIPNRKLKMMFIEDVADACGTAVSMSAGNDMICITGSVFTVGEAKGALRQMQIGNCKGQSAKC